MLFSTYDNDYFISALQSQKAWTVYLKSKKLVLFDFSRQICCDNISNILGEYHYSLEFCFWKCHLYTI